MTRSVTFTRGLLLVVLFSVPSLSFISSAAQTLQSDLLTPPLVLADSLIEGSFATIFPLKRRDVNSSSSLTERNRRNLLGDARMPLHDDLLSKG